MSNAPFGSPLIVWLGPRRYAFAPGRDVTVGVGGDADIRVERVGAAAPEVVLHFNGRQWIAVDRSDAGVYVDGIRMSTVFIHDGRAITLGDPQGGPRLVFQLPAPPAVAPPAAAPPPRGAPPPPHVPAPPPRPTPPRVPPPRPVSAPPVPPPRPMSAPPTPPPQRPVSPPPPRPMPPPARPAMPPPAPQRVLPPPMPPPSAPIPTPPPPAPLPVEAESVGPPEPGRVARLTGALSALTARRRRTPAPETGAAAEPPPAPVGAPAPTTIAGPVEARRVRLSIDGEQALADLSFTAAPGTITSVIGLSEASATALVDVLAGVVRPSVGEVDFDGHDVAADDVRPHIAVIARHDLMRPHLTVEQTLSYAAQLRFAPEVSVEQRRAAVQEALDKLELTALRTAKAGTLSAEERKRASLALEVLTDPSLIVVDEPTAGLDPQAAQRIMTVLRRLADEGRVILVATTTPTQLDVCDQVVVLTPTGIPVFAGSPSQIGDQLGTTDWAAIVKRARTDPYGAHDAYLARQPEPPPEPAPASSTPTAPPLRRSLLRQVAVCTRRQLWLQVGDQRFFIFLAMLPTLVGAVALLIPGDAGLGPASRYGSNPDQAVAILTVLTLGAVLIGTALGIRDLFGEQPVFRREQAHGLSATAFLAGKLLAYSLTAVVGAAIITAAATAGHHPPVHGGAALGHTKLAAGLELFLALSLTGIVSALVAAALSSLARYAEQIALTAALIVLASLVFAGALFPIADRFPLEQFAGLVPSRWGFAAAAATVDVHAVNPLAEADDSWRHTSGQWLFDIGVLAGFGVAALAALRWRLRRPSHRLQPATISDQSAL